MRVISHRLCFLHTICGIALLLTGLYRVIQDENVFDLALYYVVLMIFTLSALVIFGVLCVLKNRLKESSRARQQKIFLMIYTGGTSFIGGTGVVLAYFGVVDEHYHFLLFLTCFASFLLRCFLGAIVFDVEIKYENNGKICIVILTIHLVLFIVGSIINLFINPSHAISVHLLFLIAISPLSVDFYVAATLNLNLVMTRLMDVVQMSELMARDSDEDDAPETAV
ncbi:unnamed protein product [Caenorhabditis brenneri]